MLQTQLDTYITRSRRSQGPLRCARPEQGRPYKHTRLVQTELYQWFTRYPNDDTQSFHSLLRILRDPNVPTGDCSPLPYPAPKNQHERMANIQSVLCRAAQAEPAFRELWNERTAFEFNCVAAENGADYQDRLTETDSIIAAEACEALAATAATARDVAGDAVAEATHAQLHLQLATNNRAIAAPIACRQAEAAYTVSLDRAITAQDACGFFFGAGLEWVLDGC
ncbi:hypothetical protein B0H14DRAFT_2560625 [Mycena olivaceomarginata]|nr:hypothetical protein B0H14DRAFT_2560625 [Mycena olivaceomarginata]